MCRPTTASSCRADGRASFTGLVAASHTITLVKAGYDLITLVDTPAGFASLPMRPNAGATASVSGNVAFQPTTGERALLNLGHTFGHALEAAAGFSGRLLHGEAISLGMVLAFEFSARRGLIPAAAALRVERHLAAVGLPTRVASGAGVELDPDRLMAFIAQDKKVKRGGLTFVLARAIGESFVAPDIDAAEVRAFLVQKLAER